MRQLPIVLFILVFIVLTGLMQWALFHGQMSVGENARLKTDIAKITLVNQQLANRNEQVYQQVLDLKNNSQATEILAREELGLVKPGEIFYRYGATPPQK